MKGEKLPNDYSYDDLPHLTNDIIIKLLFYSGILGEVTT